jgi:hypothetical protein
MAKHLAPPTNTYRNLRLGAILTGHLLVSFLVIGTSRAAFSDTTDNSGNAFTSGSVTITDDDGGDALFDVSALAPGDSHENCIEVTYTGTLSAEVRLYGTAGASSDLNDALTVTVQRGTGGGFVGTETPSGSLSCTGFVSATEVFSGTLTTFLNATNYGTGEDNWAVTNGSSAVYRFFVEFDTSDDSLQGGTSNVTFTWEAQNT